MADRGRPSVYTAKLAGKICRRLAAGESLRAICRDDGMPDESTVRGWALDNVEGFFPQYARAREIAYHGLADEVLEIADDGRNDTYVDEDGTRKVDHDCVARSRLRVDARKWMLSKVLPKIYGDARDDLAPPADHTIEDLLANLPELGRHVAFLLARAVQPAIGKSPQPLH